VEEINIELASEYKVPLKNSMLTRNMDKGFSVEQLAENIFVPEAFATENCHGWGPRLWIYQFQECYPVCGDCTEEIVVTP